MVIVVVLLAYPCPSPSLEYCRSHLGVEPRTRICDDTPDPDKCMQLLHITGLYVVQHSRENNISVVHDEFKVGNLYM